MKFNLKTWLPYIIAIALFALVPMIYFLPAIKGLVLFQSDIVSFRGVSKEIMDFRARMNMEPLWTNSMFGGMPAYQISTECYSDLLRFPYLFLLRWIPFPCSLIFLYCLGFFILLRTLDVNPWLAIAGSFAFAFSSFFFIVISAGHNSEANAIGFMPFVLSGVILAFKGKRWLGALLFAVSFAIELYCDHPQITYYLLLMVSVYCSIELFHAFKAKQMPGYFKTAAMLVVAAILAVGTDITSLWLTYDYGKYSTRGKSELTLGGENKTGGLTVSYATQWSYGIPETMTFLIPNYEGGSSKPIGENPELLKDTDPNYKEAVGSFDQYWGDQPFTSGPIYIGAIICFFAFLGLFIIKGRIKWFILIVTLFAIMLSWGKNFLSLTDLFFSYLPGYKMFRAVSMILVIAELALPLLAVLALDRIFKSKNFLEEKIPVRFFPKPVLGKRLFFGSLMIVGGYTLFCFLTPKVFTNLQKTDEISQRMEEVKEQYGNKVGPQELSQYREETEKMLPYVQDAREKLFTSDAGRSCVFIILAAFLVWLYAKKIIEWKLFTAVLGFFILMDMALVDWRYLNKDNFKPKRTMSVPYQADEADEMILKDPSLDYRVFNTTMRPDQDSRTSYFHKSLGGYSGVKMKRYDELLGYQIERGNMDVINMLNTKYFIVAQKGGNGEATMAEKNPGALGNAWFVNNYKIVANADSEMVAMDHFNSAETAIIDQRFAGTIHESSLHHDSNSYIQMKSYEPNDLTYISNSKSQELAVFSEIYYPDGWNAYIDGKPSDYIRVNYVLRAMLIPPGQHNIEFKFHPTQYFTGEKISLTSSILLYLGCLGFIFMQFKEKRTKKTLPLKH